MDAVREQMAVTIIELEDRLAEYDKAKAIWQAEALEIMAAIMRADSEPWDADRIQNHAAAMRRQAEGAGNADKEQQDGAKNHS